MDVQQKLDEIVAAVDGARSMPMSASCVVNRAELLAMLEDVRQALPGSLAQAQELLGGREQMVAEAQQEAQRILDGAQAERDAMISETQVAMSAQGEAERILTAARQEAEEIRGEADDYVDSKLANFEVVLSKTIGSVERGREKLLGSGPGADEYGDDYAEDAPERTSDPVALRHRADEYVDARLGSVSAVLAKTLDAVGRGRQKLLGHRPADELGAHLAAQDGSDQVPHTSDADYLAGLAETAPAAAVAPEVVPQAPDVVPQAMPPVPEPQAPPAPPAMPPQPVADPYYAAAHVEYAQQVPQPAPVPQDAYYGQQQAYVAQDPYYAQQGYDPQFYGQQPAALDETSLFDTSMIDLDQMREYEQVYGQGYDPVQDPAYDPAGAYGQGYGRTYDPAGYDQRYDQGR